MRGEAAGEKEDQFAKKVFGYSMFWHFDSFMLHVNQRACDHFSKRVYCNSRRDGEKDPSKLRKSLGIAAFGARGATTTGGLMKRQHGCHQEALWEIPNS